MTRSAQIKTELSIVGAFITLALTVNGFFLKGIYSELGSVKVQLATMSAHAEDKSMRIQKIETKQDKFEKRISELEKVVK